MKEQKTPWGSWKILETKEDFQIKILRIDLNGRLSDQRHKYRSETWIILEGTLHVQINDGKEERMKEGKHRTIPPNVWHRLWNGGYAPVVVLEIQTGSYFGEDDIERREDDYGRESF